MEEHIHVIPNGFQRTARRPRRSAELPIIGFIGNCEFTPNKDGARWFIRDVWPMVKREFPGAQLRLVGRGSDGYWKRLGPDIVGLGWLEDPGDEIATWSAMIVPIRVGGGTRVKVAEGFARRCPVVATTIGVFGYEVQDGKEFLLADRADDFAAACIRLLRNPHLREALAERAYERFLERWTWDSFQDTVGEAVHQCLTKNDASNVTKLSMRTPRNLEIHARENIDD
ncbi:MAG: glycosyltransferase family 4 protein [Terriglobales bacterium]|jgi:glycosyltransferase involved in cell wall biosynthesis